MSDWFYPLMLVAVLAVYVLLSLQGRRDAARVVDALRGRLEALEAALRDVLREKDASPQLFEALASVAGLSEAQASFLQEHANARYRLVLAATSPNPAQLRDLAHDDADASVMLACLEMLHNGTTLFGDM